MPIGGEQSVALDNQHLTARKEAGDILSLVGEHPSHWRIEVFAFDLHHRIGSFELRVMKHTANRYSHTICPFPRGTPVVPVNLTAKRAVDNNLSWLRGQSVHVTVRQHTS